MECTPASDCVHTSALLVHVPIDNYLQIRTPFTHCWGILLYIFLLTALSFFIEFHKLVLLVVESRVIGENCFIFFDRRFKLSIVSSCTDKYVRACRVH